jgi:hypothetical protein
MVSHGTSVAPASTASLLSPLLGLLARLAAPR